VTGAQESVDRRHCLRTARRPTLPPRISCVWTPAACGCVAPFFTLVFEFRGPPACDLIVKLWCESPVFMVGLTANRRLVFWFWVNFSAFAYSCSFRWIQERWSWFPMEMDSWLVPAWSFEKNRPLIFWLCFQNVLVFLFFPMDSRKIELASYGNW